MSHAKLAPSAAHRWLSCPGSVPLTADAEGTSSEYADEGTAAHELGAGCLETGIDAAAEIGTAINICNDDGTVRRSFAVDEDMASYVQVYVDSVRDRLHDTAQLLVEQRLDSGLISKLHGKVDGTGDAVILAPTFGLIEVHDLKYGKGIKVDALTPVRDPKAAIGPVILDDAGNLWELNPQLAIYGLGALNDYGLLGDFHTVLLGVHQPRLDHMSIAEISTADLLAWGASVQAYITERIDAGDETFTPSESACKWCPAKATCPGLAKFVEQTVTCDFDDIPDLAEHGIAQAYERLGLVQQWVQAISSAATALAEQGRLPGWVYEIGRQGNRKWKDAKAVETVLKKTYRCKLDEMYNKTLISPTDAEKLFKGSPRRWEDLQEHITRGEPSKKLVRASEAKNPLPAANVADDFADLVGG